MPRLEDPNILIGFETSDDAGVYKLSPECAVAVPVAWTKVLDLRFNLRNLSFT